MNPDGVVQSLSGVEPMELEPAILRAMGAEDEDESGDDEEEGSSDDEEEEEREL